MGKSFWRRKDGRKSNGYFSLEDKLLVRVAESLVIYVLDYCMIKSERFMKVSS